MPAQAFPYASWPHLSRAEVVALRGMLRGLPRELEPRIAHEARALLGASLELRGGPAALCSGSAARASFTAPLVALSLELRAGVDTLALLCELPVELGAVLVDRTLGGDGRSMLLPPATLDPVSAGVLGYFAARLLAAGGAGLRLRAVLTNATPIHALLSAEHVLVWPVQVVLDGRAAGTLRVYAPEASARALLQRSDATLPSGLSALPFDVCAHAANVCMLRSELAALGVGDVVVPRHCRLSRGESGFYGEAILHVCGTSQSGYRCSARATTLVIEGIEAKGAGTMTEGKRVETEAMVAGVDALRLAGDAPVELCLELARFRMSLAELSALRPGEVLNTGREIGARVTLSAHGQAVAHGELVEIDGEIGLRVLELVR